MAENADRRPTELEEGTQAPRSGRPTPADEQLSAIRAFVDEEVGAYLATHAEHLYPDRLVARLRGLGAFGAAVSESYGGGNWPAPGTARLSYELARGWQSLAGLVGTHLKLCRLVERHGTAEQRTAWLAPMARGEQVFARAYHEQGVPHPAQLRTRVHADGRLYGRKGWVTNARHADRIVAIARAGDATVAVLTDPGRPGVEIGPELPRPGMLGISLAEVTFTGYEFDPDEDVLGGRGHDLTEALRTYDLTSYVARALGSADAVYEAALRHVRAAMGGRSPQARGAVNLRMGELTTCRAVMRTVWQSTTGTRPSLTSGEAKVFCTSALQELVRNAALLCGGAGYAGGEAALGRHYRDALALPIIGVPSDTLLSHIGDEALA
ncbi:acyl-CoA dehydrogenase family protein [Streptomyces sp. QH1-20]|uniref:acyl-CoA dehydrogenase family protein n=1 Tax=Streptomyces sp. QH1-20 TaxID=3240934 RepID=UPI003514AE89